jgi:hypothetical protein
MKTERALPNMLPGWVCRQYVRRGSKQCGPYWYRFWRESGRLRKTYVPPERLGDVQTRCNNWSAFKRQLRHQRRAVFDGIAWLRDIREELSRINEA